MTKKDGDKLRAMRAELVTMASQYEPDGLTATDLGRIEIAITCALGAVPFQVKTPARRAA